MVLIATTQHKLREGLNAAEEKVGEVRVQELKVRRILRLALTAFFYQPERTSASPRAD